MVLSKEALKELVTEIANEETFKIVELIKGKQDVSEFLIAEKLDFTVNSVRNMLYRLQEHNLVSSIRKKDKEKGWYVYYWTFDFKKAEDLYLNRKKQRIDSIKRRLKEEDTSNFFVCKKKCDIRMKFEEALEQNFKCPECGNVLIEEKDKKVKNTLLKELESLESQTSKKKVKV